MHHFTTAVANEIFDKQATVVVVLGEQTVAEVTFGKHQAACGLAIDDIKQHVIQQLTTSSSI